MGNSLSSRNALFYSISVVIRRVIRRLSCLTGGRRFSRTVSGDRLPFSIIRHRSLLLRTLAGTDQRLQRNKVETLRSACSLMNGILVRPGETFSFWKIIGRPAAGRGFLPGLQLSSGRMVERVGGGLCQLSNLIFWMVLHTHMSVVERHRHGYDPFPDHRRVVPFGSGATIFYNYLDLMFENRTNMTFQLVLEVGDKFLEGEIRASDESRTPISIEERGHRFVRRGGTVYRENELWRIEGPADEGSGTTHTCLLYSNVAEVRYDVSSIPGVTVEED